MRKSFYSNKSGRLASTSYFSNNNYLSCYPMKYLKWLLSFSSRTVNLLFVLLLLISLFCIILVPKKYGYFHLLVYCFQYLYLLICFCFIWIFKRHFAMVSFLAIASCRLKCLNFFATNIKNPAKQKKTL